MIKTLNTIGLHAKCPILSDIDEQTISDRLIRTFELNTGDEIVLKDISGDDCFVVDRGSVRASVDDEPPVTLDGGDRQRSHLSVHRDIGRLHVSAESPAVLLQVDGNEVDNLLAWQEMLNVLGPEDEALRQRAFTIRNSKAFRNVPVEHFVDALKRLEPVVVAAGQEVVVQGEKGDAYYFIESGEAEVWSLDLYDDEPQLVNELREGDAFGEESLVMDGSRTATVRMRTAGRLLKLDKEAFLKLVSQPMVQWVDPQEARALCEQGHQLLDVRYQEEWDDYSIPGATLLPLQALRRRYTELDSSVPYIAYCKGGARSAVAALLLTQRGYQAVSLKGGIREWPYETQANQ